MLGILLSRFCTFYIGYVDLYLLLCYTIIQEAFTMHVKVITAKGVPRLYIYETYYDKDPLTGKGRVRSKMIESLGRLDELKKTYDDPVAHFKAVCEQRTAQKKEKQMASIAIGLDSRMLPGEDSLRNAGYAILKELYKQLDLGSFWNWKTRGLSVPYSVDRIFRLLVFSRILYPGSKKRPLTTGSSFLRASTVSASMMSIIPSILSPKTRRTSKSGFLIIPALYASGICRFLISTVPIITLISVILIPIPLMTTAGRLIKTENLSPLRTANEDRKRTTGPTRLSKWAS